MRLCVVGALLIQGCLAACQMTGGQSASAKGGPYAPGIAPNEQSVDGLIVGHRLMAAGEYQLALDAYYRAASDHGPTVDVLSAIGSADLKLGRLGQAETTLRDAIKVDQTFVPAWNNLGVVLMEKGEYPEASLTFKTAFALDSGHSEEIRKNLKRALALMEDGSYDPEDKNDLSLVRRGNGEYLLLTTN